VYVFIIQVFLLLVFSRLIISDHVDVSLLRLYMYVRRWDLPCTRLLLGFGRMGFFANPKKKTHMATHTSLLGTMRSHARYYSVTPSLCGVQSSAALTVGPRTEWLTRVSVSVSIVFKAFSMPVVGKMLMYVDVC
jgi:hypothetical protein